MHLILLTRPVNLLIIALTMWLVRHFVLMPIVAVNGFQLQLTDWQFAMLVLSTVFVAAAGNIINDYFDQRTDRVNKSGDIIIGVHVKRRVAMGWHQLLNLVGLGMALYVAWTIELWELALVHFFAAGTLWFYSTTFKRELFIGNVLIALLAGLVPLLVGLYEIPLLARTYGAEISNYFRLHLPNEDPMQYFQYMFYFVSGYAVFAFMLNLTRELQKDMADVAGDRIIGAKTVPIVYGIKRAKMVNAALIILTLVMLFLVVVKVVSDWLSVTYLTLAVAVPMLISLIINVRAQVRKTFVLSGNFLKLSMLFGILYSMVHFYIYYADAV